MSSEPTSDPLVQMYETRSGPMLAMRTDHYITKALELYGEYNREEWLMLKQAIRPGMIVVEAGANMGSHSIDMARACAPGLFYAFEPQQRMFQILCANLALANVTNALAYPDALGEIEGEAVVPNVDYAREGSNFGGLSLASAGSQGWRVRVRTIDDLDLPACGLIKIDVEGFELQVIRGAARTITKYRPVLYVENDRADKQKQVIDQLTSLDYQLYWHLPRLFSAENYRKNGENIFGNIVSLNMLCLPKERNASVQGLTAIDPNDWVSPIKSIL